jgi:hypothetical protein
MALYRIPLFVLTGAGASMIAAAAMTQEPGRQWLAGDPHIHSRWSLDYDESKNPPAPIHDDAIYSIPRNAQMAKESGLRWMVTTDHGGPSHATLNFDEAYPELVRSRQMVPEVLQFYGLELNMPGMDHHTVIVPAGENEARTVFEIESRFDAKERWPKESVRDTEAARVAALSYMQKLSRPPLVFANHPARSASGSGRWGQTDPEEMRQNMDVAPDVYRGMEGAPGHQAKGLERDGRPGRKGARGSYGRKGAQTLGGFDQMTAVVGGVWDALLGEGRRFWITAGSDSHIHYTESSSEGSDFWPGEFQKTYILAKPTHEDIFDGLKHGRVFVSSGDLITELHVVASASARQAAMGETLEVEAGTPVRVVIRFRDPDVKNRRGDSPRVARVDLIVGDLRDGSSASPGDRNESARVVGRFTAAAWSARDDIYQIETRLPAPRSLYIRVRGTNSNELEPSMDPIGEDPWSDLWFYSNPVFIEVR